MMSRSTDNQAQSIRYGENDATPAQLAAFYQRLGHPMSANSDQIAAMAQRSVAFVTAWNLDELIGIARGVSDGVRGYLTECKLDPAFQGPAAITRTDGRIEHDALGVAREMAERVLAAIRRTGVDRVDALAYGTEVDFLEELGFRRGAGLVGMTLGPGGSRAN